MSGHSPMSLSGVPLDPAVAQVLQDWLEDCPRTPAGWLFPNPATRKPYHESEICKSYIRLGGEKRDLGKIGWLVRR
jgi:hypothetical protein